MHPIDEELKLMLEGQFDQAWVISERLESQGPDNLSDPHGNENSDMWTRHCFNRGWFLLQQGHYQEGCQLLENGRYLNVYGSGFLRTDAPLWNPKEHDPQGKTIILSLEGGLGDEIIHARFGPGFKDRGFEKVYIAASPELKSVFARLPGVDGVIQRDQAHTVSHDYWLPGFSAGWVLGNDFSSITRDSYLSVTPQSAEVWQSFIKSDKIKVGIRWAGNPKFEHQQFRLFPPEFLTKLNRYSELQIYSFQRDHNTVELDSDIVDLQHFLISWEDTLAALDKMDLIITSCTSIAHAAAALGKPTWVVVPILPYHTWAWQAPHSTTSPYYSTVRLYRQQKPKEWTDTFQQLYRDLEQHFHLNNVEAPTILDRKLKLNLGSGFQKLQGFVNIDVSDMSDCDLKHDLMSFPWPFPDNSVDHIVAKDILEHLGNNGEDFINVMKEMYRVSVNGAAWEVQFPHHRSDIAYDDPTHIRRLTQTTFRLFDQKRALELKARNQAESPLALIHDIDIEVADVQHDWATYWREQVDSKAITEKELYFALNTHSNVAHSVIMLIVVHKPGRQHIK